MDLQAARRVIRTIVQVVISLAAATPFILDAAGVGDVVVGGVSAVAVAGAITRVMALPQVEAFLQQFLPWLAAEDRSLEDIEEYEDLV